MSRRADLVEGIRRLPKRRAKRSLRALDPVTLSVIANRIDAIVREMSHALLRSARSTGIASARDFSCTIVTGDNRLVSATDGIPVHVFGSDLQTKAMAELHSDLAPGDAFLHNDPYLGNTHAGDHTILVPVFVGRAHLFTACVKAHQADIGNAVPSTYHAAARDIYEEGALVFPCIRVERDYQTIADIVRLCRARIRVPDQWYGDFLAALGAARTGERRLVELCAKYGAKTIAAFIEAWFDYSERRMEQAIKALPKARVCARTAHDPVPPFLPDGIPIQATIAIDPDAGTIEIDLRDNIDNVPCGFNQSEACARNNALIGILNVLEPDIPRNAGSFRRITIRLREGSVVGKPTFPHSCSLATTNVGDRLINLIQSALAALRDGVGMAQGGIGMNATISGTDFRDGGKPFINQLALNVIGGAAGPEVDGWVTAGLPCGGGMTYRDSIELIEVKCPILVEAVRLKAGTGGAGRRRGSPGAEVVFGPRRDPVSVVVASDAHLHPAEGVRGGAAAAPSSHYKVSANGAAEKLPGVARFELKPGDVTRFVNSGGGGYGDPLLREPDRVLKDVLGGAETVARARDVYSVVLTGSAAAGTLAIDAAATAARRATASVRPRS